MNPNTEKISVRATGPAGSRSQLMHQDQAPTNPGRPAAAHVASNVSQPAAVAVQCRQCASQQCLRPLPRSADAGPAAVPASDMQKIEERERARLAGTLASRTIAGSHRVTSTGCCALACSRWGTRGWGRWGCRGREPGHRRRGGCLRVASLAAGPLVCCQSVGFCRHSRAAGSRVGRPAANGRRGPQLPRPARLTLSSSALLLARTSAYPGTGCARASCVGGSAASTASLQSDLVAL